MRQPAAQGPRAGAEKPPTVSDAAIHAIVTAEHGDPFAVLGPHEVAPGQWEVRAMLPDADAVAVVAPGDDRHLAEMERRHPAGFFVGRFASENRPDYRLRVETGAGTELRFDPFSFFTVISDDDVAALGRGEPEVLPRVMGARPLRLGMAEGAAFAVWAPNARRVSVVGEFNGWDGRRHPMRLRHGIGVWELFVPGVAAGARYKFEIKGPDGTVLPLKADPVAFAAEHPPATASVLHGLPDIVWDDDGWIRRRSEAADPRGEPISIYECHLGSWARVPEEGGRYLTYAELGDRLIPYVKDLGFTHIELLPITEYPFDGSWGYQPVSLFAPTSRFGTPEEFARFVDTAHAAGIGVLLDWVPGHFPNDPHGLALFDGTHLYEHADPRQGFHQDWGTFIYNFGRAEVAAFLVANARFWLDRYHLDGLRIDAVASLLYLDYSRKAGEWIPNRHGGNENLEAIEFLKRMNAAAYGAAPGVFTVAEESTAWPGVSKPAYAGGLGFGFKWNMGWMHDTLRYMQQDPIHRRYHHDDMTFGIVYAFSENFVLPLSHDEVVHGKGSLLGRMPGDRWRRFANLRAYFGFMWGHPGKKLLFMGGEFAQEREWNHDISLDWHLLDDPDHAGMHRLVGDLNRLYRETPALHELDCESQGFEWLVGGDADQSVLVWLRRGLDPDDVVVVASNFTPVPRVSYAFGVPLSGTYTEVLNTDDACYAGSGMGNPMPLSTAAVEAHGYPWRLEATLPPLSTIVLRRER